MEYSSLLEQILNRGKTRISPEELILTPVEGAGNPERLSSEEQMAIFMEILEEEQKSEVWPSGITTFRINSFREFSYQSTPFEPETVTPSNIVLKKVLCSVCKSEICSNQTLRELPCGHYFHRKCIDKWLQMKANCPLDRKDMKK
mmetsp:Transcript_2600/g.4074  ORF Transcript_2600/g.4074 Transcript_2600/m.4074 type:complete len:145 (-) Transcript_2600:35-469(-)